MSADKKFQDFKKEYAVFRQHTYNFVKGSYPTTGASTMQLIEDAVINTLKQEKSLKK